MEEGKSGLYIIGIVGVIAVVALVVLVLSGGHSEVSSSTQAVDSAGQAMAGACKYQCQNICTPTQYCINQTIPILLIPAHCTTNLTCSNSLNNITINGSKTNSTTKYCYNQTTCTPPTYRYVTNTTCYTNQTCKSVCGTICGTLRAS